MKRCICLLTTIGLLVVVRSTVAQTWTQTTAPSGGWRAVASSADGSKLIASGILNNVPNGSWLYFVSTNSGATWTTNIQPQVNSTYGGWAGVSISADGTIFTGWIANEIWVSTNSGNTWISNTVPNASVTNFAWFGSVALSADGSKMVAGAGLGTSGSPFGGIYLSTNWGVSWEQTTAPTNNWTSVASSADGSRLVATISTKDNTTLRNFIYVSTNSGTTWTLTEAPTNLPWISVASSADGTKLVAANSYSIWGSIYTSTNSGQNWVSNNLPSTQWMGVASSADGSKLVAIAQSLPIYTSTNSGVTWVPNNISSPVWKSVASSADGTKLVAASIFGINGMGTGNIFTLQTTPTPQLNIASSASNLALSWTIPSINFVLQQSPDLISWALVTNAPALNFTNLQNQVTLSPTNSSGFFRLMSQ